MKTEADYEAWLQSIPAAIRGDALWSVTAYRLALFLDDRAWDDVAALIGDRRTISVADQLNRSVGSVGANIAEGFSRGSGRDRARFYEYALGSVRESRHWYWKCRHVLGETVLSARLEILTRLAQLLLRMVPEQRSDRIREDTVPYVALSALDTIQEDA